MIEFVIDSRKINGDVKAYAAAVKSALEDFWRNDQVKVSVVDYDVLHAALADNEEYENRILLINAIAEKVLNDGNFDE